MNEAWLSLLWFISGIAFVYSLIQFNRFIKTKPPYKSKKGDTKI